MSDIQVASDWWQASDGKWYPPSLQSGHTYGVISEQAPSRITTHVLRRPASIYIAIAMALLVGLLLVGGATIGGISMLKGEDPRADAVRAPTTLPSAETRIDAAMTEYFKWVPEEFWSGGSGTGSVKGMYAKGVARSRSDQAAKALIQLLEDLGFDNAVLAKIEDTSALDGRQSDTSDCCEVSWTYHPKNGLSVVIEPR